MSLYESLLVSKSRRRHFVRNNHVFPFAAKLAATIQLQRFIRGHICRLRTERQFQEEKKQHINDNLSQYSINQLLSDQERLYQQKKNEPNIGDSLRNESSLSSIRVETPWEQSNTILNRQNTNTQSSNQQGKGNYHPSQLSFPRMNINYTNSINSIENTTISQLLIKFPKDQLFSNESQPKLSVSDTLWLINRWKFSLHRETYQHLIYYQKFSIFSDACFVIQRQYRLHKQYLVKTYGKKCFIDKRKRIRFYDSAHDSAAMIQRAWKRFLNRQIFLFYRDLIRFRELGDPKEMLRSINPREAQLLDKASGVHVRFRLGGSQFPPAVFYKIFIHSPLIDINAFAPRDYTKHKPITSPDVRHNKRATIINKNDESENNETSGWYTREENNGWRSIAGNSTTIMEQEDDVSGPQNIMAKRLKAEREVKKNDTLKFHYSKLMRKQDIEKKKKQRKIEWMRKMYQMTSKQLKEKKKTDSSYSQSLTQSKLDNINSDTKAKDLFSGIDDPEVLDILKWCESLDYNAYEEEWRMLATSSGSDLVSMTTSDKLLMLQNNSKKPEFVSQLKENIDQSISDSRKKSLNILNYQDFYENGIENEVIQEYEYEDLYSNDFKFNDWSKDGANQKDLVNNILQNGATMDDYMKERSNLMNYIESHQ